jgi:hypothetical protein
MAKKQAEQVQATEQPSQEQTQPVGITLQDLVFVAQLIQLTSQRGAYKAEELAEVGTLYNKLIAFLQSTGAISPAVPQEEK